MKSPNIHQEILIFKNTSFAHREFCSLENDTNHREFSNEEKLEKACWNGLLCEMLPEVTEDLSQKDCYINQIISSNHFLLINVGTFDNIILNETSIDPYFFVLLTCYN